MDAIDSLPVAPLTVSARLVELLFCFETCFQNNLVSFLHRSLERMSALTEASLRLHWRSKYLNLALEVFMSSNTSPCLGLLDLIQNLKASLASECAGFNKIVPPRRDVINTVAVWLRARSNIRSSSMQTVNNIIIQTQDVLNMTTIFTRGVTATDGLPWELNITKQFSTFICVRWLVPSRCFAPVKPAFGGNWFTFKPGYRLNVNT